MSLAHSSMYMYSTLCGTVSTCMYVQFIKSGRLRHFPNIHGGLGGVYQTPCVVFTGHPSLRCGDAVHFMEAWGNSPKNCVIFTGTCLCVCVCVYCMCCVCMYCMYCMHCVYMYVLCTCVYVCMYCVCCVCTVCVVYCMYCSCGDALYVCIIIFYSILEPDFDYLHALAPYQPISMKVYAQQ